MLSVENINLTLGNRQILRDVSFQITRGEKVGLVGVNGAGKSSLLKVITGVEKADTGRVVAPPLLGYLPQEAGTAFPSDLNVFQCMLESRGLLSAQRELESLTNEMSRLGNDPANEESIKPLVARFGELQHEYEAFGGYDAEPIARRLLSGLGLGHVPMEQPFSKLSGGQKTRLALAALLFSQPDLLVLDEPTNHLDRQSAGWLMDYLVGFPGAVLVVSHDLVLLDRAISRVLRIDEYTAELETYRGNYSSYLTQSEARKLQAEKQAQKIGREVGRLQVAADRWRVGSRHEQASAIDRRIARLRDDIPDKVAQSKTVRVKPIEVPQSGKTVLEVEEVWKAYGETIVLTGVSFTLERGQKLALIGPNGAGKTTLLKIITGALEADDGTVLPGHNVRTGLYAQEHESLEPTATVLEEARRSAASSGLPPAQQIDGYLRNYLGSFLFSGAKVQQRVGTLSGGERTRLALAKLFIERPNLLLLDEPTNNLDPASQEALLKALQGYTGSVVIVCHVADFMTRLAPERALMLPDGVASLFDPALLALGEPPRRGGPRMTQAGSASGSKPGTEAERGVAKEPKEAVKEKGKVKVGAKSQKVGKAAERAQQREDRRDSKRDDKRELALARS